MLETINHQTTTFMDACFAFLIRTSFWNEQQMNRGSGEVLVPLRLVVEWFYTGMYSFTVRYGCVAFQSASGEQLWSYSEAILLGAVERWF